MDYEVVLKNGSNDSSVYSGGNPTIFYIQVICPDPNIDCYPNDIDFVCPPSNVTFNINSRCGGHGGRGGCFTPDLSNLAI